MKMLIFTVLVSMFASALAWNPLRSMQNLRPEWEAYKLKFNRSYSSYNFEDQINMSYFALNKILVYLQNLMYQFGMNSYQIEINKFSDIGVDPKSSRGLKIPIFHIRTGSKFVSIPTDTGYPETIDWRTLGAVTPVKNQFNCGASWAFSATGALEGQHFKKTGQLVTYSEQQLIFCVSKGYGCHDGLPEDAFKYIRENSRLQTDGTINDNLSMGEICKFKSLSTGASDVGYVDIGNSELEILQAVATVGPVSVGIFTEELLFMGYQSGIYDSENCVGSPNHAVLIVGYGSENGLDYWIIKNSWGLNWGEKGYMRMIRGKNMCNITSLATYPLV